MILIQYVVYWCLLVVVGPNWPRSKLMKPDTSRMKWVNKGIIIDIFCIISISHSRLRQGEDDLSGFCGGLAKVTRDAGCWICLCFCCSSWRSKYPNMKSLLNFVNAYGYIYIFMDDYGMEIHAFGASGCSIQDPTKTMPSMCILGVRRQMDAVSLQFTYRALWRFGYQWNKWFFFVKILW